jgi:hypothetical protein
MYKLPTFEYREWYEISITTIDEINQYFLKRKINDNNYFRGMNKYEYICISSFYRYFLLENKDLKWEDTEIGFNRKILLSKIALYFACENEFDSDSVV